MKSARLEPAAKGYDVNMANRHGHTSLAIAPSRSHRNYSSLLQKENININAASTRGNTALHDAAEAGNLEILQVFFSWRLWKV